MRRGFKKTKRRMFGRQGPRTTEVLGVFSSVRARMRALRRYGSIEVKIENPGLFLHSSRKT